MLLTPAFYSPHVTSSIADLRRKVEELESCHAVATERDVQRLQQADADLALFKSQVARMKKELLLKNNAKRESQLVQDLRRQVGDMSEKLRVLSFCVRKSDLFVFWCVFGSSDIMWFGQRCWMRISWSFEPWYLGPSCLESTKSWAYMLCQFCDSYETSQLWRSTSLLVRKYFAWIRSILLPYVISIPEAGVLGNSLKLNLFFWNCVLRVCNYLRSALKDLW